MITNLATLSDHDRNTIMGFSQYAITKKYCANRLEASNISNTRLVERIEMQKNLLRIPFSTLRRTRMIYPTFHIRQDNGRVLRSLSLGRDASIWNYRSDDGNPVDVAFNKNDIVSIKTYFEQMVRIANEVYNRTMNAVAYYGTAIYNYDYRIRFTLFVTALESLFNTSADQISESIAVRCSSLLSKNEKEKNDYYERIKRLYRMRSSLVHGRKIPVSYMTEPMQILLINDADFFARNSILSIFGSRIRLQCVYINKYFSRPESSFYLTTMFIDQK